MPRRKKKKKKKTRRPVTGTVKDVSWSGVSGAVRKNGLGSAATNPPSGLMAHIGILGANSGCCGCQVGIWGGHDPEGSLWHGLQMTLEIHYLQLQQTTTTKKRPSKYFKAIHFGRTKASKERERTDNSKMDTVMQGSWDYWEAILYLVWPKGTV